jgi:hypothetical protein
VDNAQESSQTPLEVKLERIAELIGYFGLGAGIVTLVALMIRFAISFTDEVKDYNKTSKIETIITGLLFNMPYKRIEEGIANNTDSNLIDPRLNVAKKNFRYNYIMHIYCCRCYSRRITFGCYFIFSL